MRHDSTTVIINYKQTQTQMMQSTDHVLSLLSVGRLKRLNIVRQKYTLQYIYIYIYRLKLIMTRELIVLYTPLL